MVLIQLFSIFFFSFLLIKATKILIFNLRKLSQSSRIGEFALTSFIMALATTLPELFVGITSALRNSPALSLGNVIGSNIVDLSLVIGGAAFIGGGLTVGGIFLKRDVFYAFLAGAAPMILLFDRDLSRIDGLILIVLYGFYNFSVLVEGRKQINSQDSKKKELPAHPKNYHNSKGFQELALIFLSAAVLLFASDMVVRSALKLASILGLPILVVGLLLVAIGTSLPELFFQASAARKHLPQMVFGNLLGSVVSNGTLIIGITALISPFRVTAYADYLLATMSYVFIFGLFYLFIRTKKRLERWEGALLILYFFVFACLEFLR